MLGNCVAEMIEENACLLCQEPQKPEGISQEGKFYCNTCEREWILEKRKIPRSAKALLSSSSKTEFLLDCLSLFNSSIGIHELLDRFASLVSERMDRNKIAVFISDLELGEIKLLYYSAKHKAIERAIKRIKVDYDLGYGVLIESMASRKSHFYKLKEQSHPFYKFYSELTGTKSQLLLPIVYGNVAVGMLAVDYEVEDFEPYQDDQDILSLVLGQFAVSLRNVSLYDKSQNQSRNFQSLHTAALTLSKLYTHDHEEMIKMILLTLSGIVDSTISCLLELQPSGSEIKIYKLFRNLENYNIHTEIEIGEISHLLNMLEESASITVEPHNHPFFLHLGVVGREALILPIKLDNGTDCVFTMVKPESRFPREEIEALNAFVSLARITMENAILYQNLAAKERLEKEIEIAKEIQTTLLPRKPPETPFFKFGGLMMPARGIGGDYYDFILSPDSNELFLCIGDVSGKGVAAGLVMATVRTILHSLVRVRKSTWDIVNDINSYLYQSYKDSNTPRFMSLILMKWSSENQKIIVSGAGHGYFYLYKNSTDALELIDTGGVILGISPDISQFRNEHIIDFAEGDCLFMFTDGVTEALNPQEEQFGEERLIQGIKDAINKQPKEVLEEVWDKIRKFMNDKEQHDDITMVAVKKLN